MSVKLTEARVRCPVAPRTTLSLPMPIYEYRCTNGHTSR